MNLSVRVQQYSEIVLFSSFPPLCSSNSNRNSRSHSLSWRRNSCNRLQDRRPSIRTRLDKIRSTEHCPNNCRRDYCNELLSRDANDRYSRNLKADDRGWNNLDGSEDLCRI